MQNKFVIPCRNSYFCSRSKRQTKHSTRDYLKIYLSLYRINLFQ